MIVERNSGIAVEGNMTGAEYKAGIDDEDMMHVIGLFTDLYSDQIRAVTREYSTNARDAMIEAGVGHLPIEVTLPTSLTPFFKVKDHGVGLGEEDIKTIYSRYGKSSKRATNDQNGALGLGCKSALTYTQQFTVESVKDGYRTICSISREDGGVPVFNVIATVPDDGPNGTEVIVPVQRQHHTEFERKAADFFRFWEPGTVLVNGKEPKPQGGLRLTDDLLVVQDDSYSYGGKQSYVVMSGVAYPVEKDHLHTGLPNNYYLVANVPNGSVTFTPSREALMYTKQTRETLSKVKPALDAALQGAVQREIDAASTHREAVSTALKWRALMGNVNLAAFKFKGLPMPEKIQGYFTLVHKNSRKIGQSDSAPNGLGVDYFTNALVVVGYDVAKFTPTHKRKLLQYIEENGRDCNYFILSYPQPDMTWIDPSQIIKWEDVKAVKLPTNSSASVWRNGRPTGSYDAFIGGSFQHIQADAIDQNEPVYYARSQNRWDAGEQATLVGKYLPDATVVCLPENRYAKFMRNFPEAKTLQQGCQDAYNLWLSTLSPGQRAGIHIYDAGEPAKLRRLDPSRINDPALRRDIYIAKHTQKAVEAAIAARQDFRYVLYAVRGAVEYDNPFDAYPLMDSLSIDNDEREHVYIYLNAAYAARKEA